MTPTKEENTMSDTSPIEAVLASAAGEREPATGPDIDFTFPTAGVVVVELQAGQR